MHANRDFPEESFSSGNQTRQYKNVCWKVSNSIFNNKNIAKKALNLTQLSHTTSKQNEYAHIYTHYIYTLDTVDPWQRRVCRSVTCL